MKALLGAFGLLLLVLTVGCANSPQLSPAQIAAADYGTPLTNPELVVRTYLRRVLVDPDSLKDLEVGTPRRAYTLTSDVAPAGIFGYIVPVEYNAKNRMGGYVGLQQKAAFVRDGRVIFLENWDVTDPSMRVVKLVG